MTAFRSGWPLWCALVVAASVVSIPRAVGAEPTVELRAWMGNKSSIQAIAFSPDGKLVALAGGDGQGRNEPIESPDAELTIRDVTTHEKLAALEGHTDSVWSVSFSPDSKTLATSSADKTVRLWDVATGKELAALKDAPCGVSSVAFSPDGKTLAGSAWVCFGDDNKADWSKPGEVLLWDVATRKVRATLKMATGIVWQLAFSPDGKTLATAAQKLDKEKDEYVGAEVWFWDAATGKHTGTLKAHPVGFSAFAYSPDGKTLATAGDQWEDTENSPGRTRVKLWDTTTLKLKTSEPTFEARVKGLAFSPDGTVLVVGSSHIVELGAVGFVFRYEAVVLDAKNLKELAKLPRQKAIDGLLFHPKKKVFATINGRWIDLWELSEKR